MRIEAHNLDSLRKLVRELQDENKRLKEYLKKANIPFPEEKFFEENLKNSEDYDPDQCGRIIKRRITDAMVRYFFSMFWGRMDVFAKRGKKGGYFPQCDNRWNDRLCPKQRGEKIHCESCKNRQWTKLTPDRILNHLLGYREDGSDVLGIYPLFPDCTCRFIVFDFDNHEKGTEANDFANIDEEWHKEVDALRIICENNGITPLVERSRSGRGAHLWIFFKKPVSASLARNFGYMLLDKGSASINMKSFKYYDRMYPSGDTANSLGNLIALPLQGQAIKRGNSAFVDRNWNAYPDQWDILLNHTVKLSLEDIELYMTKWKADLSETVTAPGEADRPKPWRKKQSFSKADVVGDLHIVLGDGIYVDTLNLMPRIQNQIRSMAAFDNPIFYRNKRLGLSNYYNFSAIYMGRDEDGYICIPRGLKDNLISACNDAGITYDITDNREKGRPIRVSFMGDLRTEQDLAAERMLHYDHGVLSAATAFGKTVVCSYLIAKRKVSTLILLQSKDLLEQWVEELNRFLKIDEELPVYKTKTGKEKRRSSVIGTLTGNKNTLTGIIDVAMVGSAYGKGDFNELLNSYGMVIMDECHHCGSNTSIKVMQRVNAAYVYGVSATPKRGDQMEKIIYMLIGPIRHSYTAREKSMVQGIEHYMCPRFTGIIDLNNLGNDINAAYTLISGNVVRNDMIVSDVQTAVASGRTPVILTRFKEHAKKLYEHLKTAADFVFILYGDNTDKENSEIRRDLKNVPRDKSLILIATGQKIGEGFDFPRLDTLMLAAPVSFSGRLEQFVGRLNRDYEGKKEVMVYDYVDSRIGVFRNMYSKRLRTYRKLGYKLITDPVLIKQEVNAIFGAENYAEVFERDLVEAEKRIVVSSPQIEQSSIDRFMRVIKSRQEAGCDVTVITTDPDYSLCGDAGYGYFLISQMQNAGINVLTKEESDEHFALIDDELVWYGSVNLLGKKDSGDNMMRVKSAKAAEELLTLTLAYL